MIPNKNAIMRLSRYRNVLYRLKEMGFARIISTNLADAADVTPLQVRKDFSLFKITGNKKGGYKVDEIIEKLDKILGKNVVQNVIIVGAGKIGKALIEYKGFEKEGLKICAAFDIDSEKYNFDSDIQILPLEKLRDFVRANNIKIAIIAVPDTSGQQVLDLVVSSGIKGVLNFAPIRLRKNGDLVINNVNIVLELEKLIYFVDYVKREKHE